MSLPILAQGRECGECDACCVHLKIKEPATIAHEAHVDCCRLGDDGCTEYAARPETCVRFKCLWLTGFGDDVDRPDIIGVIFHLNEEPVNGLPIMYVAANETREGALASGTPGLKAAQVMGYEIPVLITKVDGSGGQIVPLSFDFGYGKRGNA